MADPDWQNKRNAGFETYRLWIDANKGAVRLSWNGWDIELTAANPKDLPALASFIAAAPRAGGKP